MYELSLFTIVVKISALQLNKIKKNIYLILSSQHYKKNT